MAVQTHYSSNILLLKRSEQEMNPPTFGPLDESAILFFNGGSANPRKKGREAAAAAAVPMGAPPPPENHPINGYSLFSMQSQPSIPATTFISLDQLRTRPALPVSTGLHLAFGNQNLSQNLNQSNTLVSSSFLPQEFSAQINQYEEEIDQVLRAQGEQLRRTLAENQQRHCRSLLMAAEESAAQILREKEAELDRAARLTAELEDRLAWLRAESLAWQAKAMAEHSIAASLHTQLQQISAARDKLDECGESPAEDAESAHVDLDRAIPHTAAVATCRVCRTRTVSIVLLPCRHLCLCSDCDAVDDAGVCPVCRCIRAESIQVLLS